MPRYTLLIPTHNRPELLRSLLGYLDARSFEYPVRILDSSKVDIVAANNQAISELRLDIVHEVYDSTISPYAKYALGVRSVDTAYCSFCADDDILLIDSLIELLDVLDADPAFVAAHGYYLNVLPGDEFQIQSIAYAGPSIIGGDALVRIMMQMRNYQAVFYAVYRVSILKSVLQRVQSMTTLLSLELLSSSLTLVAGGVYRSKSPYLARNTSPSIATSGWHPHQFLARDPEVLFLEYDAYRATLLQDIAADTRCRTLYEPDRIRRILDLVHMQYLAPQLSSPVLDSLISASFTRDRELRHVVDDIWRKGALPPRQSTGGVAGFLALARCALARDGWRNLAARMIVRMLCGVKLLGMRGTSLNFMGAGGVTIERTARGGQLRRYVLAARSFDVKLPNGGRITRKDVMTILSQLDDYV